MKLGKFLVSLIQDIANVHKLFFQKGICNLKNVPLYFVEQFRNRAIYFVAKTSNLATSFNNTAMYSFSFDDLAILINVR